MLKINKGFSLIESVVVMVILATAMSGSAYLLGTVIKTTEINKNQIKAIYLAQECTELVRNFRDTMWKRHLPWDCMFKDANVEDEFIIEADYSTSTLQVCDSQVSPQVMGMKWESATVDNSKIYLENEKYSHNNSGDETGFSRKVILKEKVLNADGDSERMVFNCEVELSQGSGRKVILQSSLSNWYKL